MTLPVSGPISMSQVAAELQLPPTTQLALGDPKCYALAGKTVGQPISMSDFYGKTFMYSVTYSASTNNVNLYNAAIAAGWNGTNPLQLNVTVNSGVIICSGTTSTPAMTINNFPAGTVIQITNNGYILGRGGNGGSAQIAPDFGNPGSPGGNAIQTTGVLTLRMINNNVIGGGGGGGGAALFTYGGSSNWSVGGGGGAPYGLGGACTGADNKYPGSAAGLGPAGGAAGNGGSGRVAGNGGSWGTDGATGYWGGNYAGSYRLGGTAGKSIFKTDNNATVDWVVTGSVYN